jgi:glucose/arabinose dehydrogenase
MSRSLAVLGVLLAAGCGDTPPRGVGLHVLVPSDTDAAVPPVRLEPLADGLVQPTVIAALPGRTDLWIADRPGGIWHVTPAGDAVLVADLGPRIVPLDPDGDERGLVGLALHPGSVDDTRLLLHWTAPPRPDAPAGYDHTATIAELVVADDGTVGEPRVILEVDAPQAGDVGGPLAFDPGGALLIALGDGGGTGDRGFGHAPGGNAQDLSSLLGKVLRIDVDVPDAPYAIPTDNPLVGPGDLGRPEVWAWGFHDPRGLAVDHDRVLVADRGQDRQEEVTAVTAGTNAGWPVREGTLCFDADDPTRPPTTCRDVGPLGAPLVEPVIALPHPGTGIDGVTVASTIVGGAIVQGVALPGFAGDLVLGDRALVPSAPTGRLLAAGVRRPGDGLLWDPRPVDVAARPDDLGAWLLGIGVDGAGTPCVLTAEEPGPTGTTGAAWRVVPADGADSF